MSGTINQQVVEQLNEIADLLEQQGANPFRVNAYRRAADTVRTLERGVDEIVERQGVDGLEELPGIGSGIARAVYEIVARGRSTRLDNLRGAVEPEQAFRGIPGVGPELARRIHDELQVDSLEALEVAAHSGRLERVPGVGVRRAEAIRAALASMLGRRGRRARAVPVQEPSVELLLDVDREYRRKAAAGKLPTIAPRRFNLKGEAWLPILHTSRGEWHFTVLFSNTARAHELGRTRDWVVLYFYDRQHRENQRTVVTQGRGALAGKRVVRGREAECLAYYEQRESA
ncbi:MAG: DNA-binding protein [Gammaproteobacteria bacterium]|nr:DNA-binding protein [Gammaproteobacteria bacterium]NIR28442.1 DNA-binding protein [Gammaproteobacteria bacterium]NIR96888.1 DNA-binding protein [Gammaproteobacteria bacterium]NIT62589.1 DNA-binding protein [Gammaproteobacteria bacterium]NIV19546.1 DNA-binding protein [Gammaproteobacteria bacterium]